jgi:aspartyl-tRNA(Asn)/glutamyl-tRNA(Gln) amidotransferase subunit C
MTEIISEKDTKSVAKLARIHINNDEELGYYTEQLNRILGIMQQLVELDVTGVAPTHNIRAADSALYMRDDVITDGNCHDKIMANAPNHEYGFFVVPKMVE